MAKKNSSFLRSLNPILVVLLIGLSFFVGVLWQKVNNLEKGRVTSPTSASGNPATQPAAPRTGKLAEEKAKLVPRVNENDHFKGSQDAKVFLIEYSDFQCPYCASFHPTAQKLIDEYGDRVAWVYRHFPLDSIHPQARPSALASECLVEQGGNEAFWRFADFVFADQETTLNDLEETVQNLGFELAKFSTCFSEKKYASEVESDYQGGVNAGITGTPGNFVVTSQGDAWYLPGAVAYTTLKSTVDEALQTL